jgi:hypothetical protein
MGIREKSAIRLARRSSGKSAPILTSQRRKIKSTTDFVLPPNILAAGYGTDAMLGLIHAKYFDGNRAHRPTVGYLSTALDPATAERGDRDLDGLDTPRAGFTSTVAMVEGLARHYEASSSLETARIEESNGNAHSHIALGFGLYDIVLSSNRSKSKGDNIELHVNLGGERIASVFVQPETPSLVWLSSAAYGEQHRKICELMLWSILDGHRFLREFLNQAEIAS